MAARPRIAHRLIYNQDSTDLFYKTAEPITPEHVDAMVDEVADAGVDLMIINANSQRTNYPSRVWTTFWDGFDPARPDNAEFIGPVPPDETERREHCVRQLHRLASLGCDYLERALARCRRRGLASGVSIRMNDMHDRTRAYTHLFSRFYLDHPEMRIPGAACHGRAPLGLDYRRDAVREHFLALIREIAAGYDFDVLELDFLRFPTYFPAPASDEDRRALVEFVRRVRGLSSSERRLIVRVAATPDAAFELGFDVEELAREGLVDAITFGMFFNTGWEMPVEAFRERVGDDVALYPTLEYTADRRSGLPFRTMATDPDLLRGFASAYLAGGADGVYLFNFFVVREQAAPDEPRFHDLPELKSLDTLRGRPKTYLTTAGLVSLEAGLPLQVPLRMTPHETRGFEMRLAAEPPGVAVRIEVAFRGTVEAERLWLRLNRTPLGRAVEVVPETVGDARIERAVFRAPAEALRDGPNQLVLRHDGLAKDNTPLDVLGLEVHVGR